MVSSIKYPDFKGKGEKIKMIPVILTILVAGYILFVQHNAILFVIFFAYALLGILNTILGLFSRNSSC
jgi:CDP-diacylglycerol--serine O-phosphatidyltransferase